MKVDHGLEMIKLFEGCKLNAYLDIVNVPTIGYGSTGADIKLGMVWTQEEAEQRLAKDLEKFRLGVIKGCKEKNISLTANQYGALVCFAYNLGLGSFNMLIKKRSSAAELAEGMIKYIKAGGVPVRGLKIRRYAEQDLFLTADEMEYNVADRIAHFRKTVTL